MAVVWVFLILGPAVMAMAAGGKKAVSSPDAGQPATPPPPSQTWWAKASAAPGYDKATAHDPQFNDREIWPRLSGREYFVTKQQWPKARLLIWTKPGMVAGPKGRQQPADFANAANWLEYASAADAVAGKGGQPAKEPPDADTDIVFPDSATPYNVRMTEQSCRHLTVGRNAIVEGLHNRVTGNIWVKFAGAFSNMRNLRLLGAKRHTFYRVDRIQSFEENQRYPAADKFNDKFPGGISPDFEYLFVDRAEGSVEMLGTIVTRDDFAIVSGTAILGPDSDLCLGGLSTTPTVYTKGTLVMMDGSRYTRTHNEPGSATMIFQGQLLGGLPERPLTRDCFLGFDPFPGGHPGFLFHGSVAVNRAPGSQASIVAYWPDFKRYLGGKGGVRSAADDWASMPKKGAVFIGRNATLNGLRLEDLARGGVILEDASTRSRLAGVAFGARNDAAGDALFKVDPGVATRDYSAVSKPGGKYIPGDAGATN